METLEKGARHPFPVMTAKRAEGVLGLDREVIQGLVSTGKVLGLRQPGASGEWVYLIAVDAVEDLRKKLEVARA